MNKQSNDPVYLKLKLQEYKDYIDQRKKQLLQKGFKTEIVISLDEEEKGDKDKYIQKQINLKALSVSSNKLGDFVSDMKFSARFQSMKSMNKISCCIDNNQQIQELQLMKIQMQMQSQFNQLNKFIKQPSSDNKETKDVQKKVIQRRSGIVNNNFTNFIDSLYPFSLASEVIILDNPFNLTNEALKTNLNTMEIAFNYEKQIKTKIIQQIMNVNRRKYLQEIQTYNQELEQFIQKNIKCINNERARLMMMTPTQVLHQIHLSETIQREKKEQLGLKSEIDSLPFTHIKKLIAANMDSAPVKSKLILSLNLQDFKHYFCQYHKEMRKVFGIIENQGIMKINQQLSKLKNENQQKQQTPREKKEIKIKQGLRKELLVQFSKYSK